MTYLRDAWTGHGWSLHDERDIGDAPVLVWQKDNRVCRLELLAAGHDTEAWLRCSVRG